MDGMPHVAGVEHRVVEARGLRFHVAEAGAGDPLVLLHGWPQHWYLWRDVIPAVATRFRVICPDMRGFGWSDAPPAGYEKEELASDLLALLDALGLDRVRLCGHDWGGWVGFLACLRAPERFDRFLALSIIHPFVRLDPRRAGALRRLWYQAVIAAPGVGEALVRRGDFTRRLMRSAAVGDPFDEEELAAFADRLREPARARASVQLYRSFLLREIGPIIRGRYAGARLRVPTLLLLGDRDPAIRADLLEGGERQGGLLRAELLPGHSHFVVDEDPALIGERLLAFMAADQDA